MNNSGRKTDKNTIEAILLVIVTGFFYALMAVLAKSAGDISAAQKVCFRNFFMSIIVALPLMKDRSVFKLNGQQWKWLLLRGAFATIGVVTTFYIYDHMSLADATILVKMAPCFVFITSVLLLKERVNMQNIAPVVISFVGAYLVIRPTFSSEPFAAVVAIISAIATGISHTMIVKLGSLKVNKSVILLSFSVLSTLVTLPFVIMNFTPMSMKQVVIMLLCTACATIGQMTLTIAYTKAAGKVISVFEYSQVVFAAVFDLLVFSMMPDGIGLVGYVLIIGAAVYNAVTQSRKDLIKH